MLSENKELSRKVAIVALNPFRKRSQSTGHRRVSDALCFSSTAACPMCARMPAFPPGDQERPECKCPWKENGAQSEIVFTKVLNHIVSRMEGIHHYKVGMRIDGFKRTSHCLIEKLLTVVRVLLNEGAHSIGVVQRSCGRSDDYRVNVVFGGELPQLLNDFR